MLWSLIKILLFLAAIAALALGVDALQQREEVFVITFGGVEYTLRMLDAAVGLVLLAGLLWLGLKLVSLGLAILRFINGDETALSRYFDSQRERRGYAALAEALTAVAAGEGQKALTLAHKARRLLKSPALTDLITAQAAEVCGDVQQAEAIYKRLLGQRRTRFVGVRGLLRQKLAAGEPQTALKLAEAAFALNPRHRETQDMVLRLQGEHQDWAGARQTLAAKLRYGALPRGVYQRRDAVLTLGEAQQKAAAGDRVGSQELAMRANRLSPDLVPAAVMAAQGLRAQGQHRAAIRVLQKAWRGGPHPDLAVAFADLSPQEQEDTTKADATKAKAAKRVARLEKFLPPHQGTAEARLVLAQAHIAAEDFPAARRALGDLCTTAPTVRALTLMAAIAQGEGATAATIRDWLTRALAAPPDRQWICENCHNVAPAWQPVCTHCRGLDTLAWRTAPLTTAPEIGAEALQSLRVPPAQERTDAANPAGLENN